MHWVIMSTLSVSLVEQMGSQPKWSVIFVFTCLIFSQLPAYRVNLLIKLLNDCMDRPTNAMQSDKLPSVTEDLNVLVWRLTGSSSMPALSKNQWITKMIRWRVTRTCGITSLHQKIDLWTYLIRVSKSSQKDLERLETRPDQDGERPRPSVLVLNFFSNTRSRSLYYD